MRALGLGLLILLGACAPAPSSPTTDHVNARSYARWALLPSSSVIPAGAFSLAGKPATCDAAQTVLNPHLDDTAAAYDGFIVVNLRRLAPLPAGVQLWAYAHECGHIRLGPDEARADCAAVDEGVAKGWLDAPGVDQVCDYIRTADTDLKHGSGAARCQAMRLCYAKAQTQN
jgi:hypothetical protein